MLIKLLFADFFEGENVRVVGIYHDGYVDDGSGNIRVFFEGKIKDPSRVDVIGIIENKTLYVYRRREIDFKTEVRRRKKALELVHKYIGDIKTLINQTKDLILKELKGGPLSYRDLRNRLKDKVRIEAAFKAALSDLVSSGTIIEIEPGVYML